MDSCPSAYARPRLTSRKPLEWQMNDRLTQAKLSLNHPTPLDLEQTLT
ncbi:protein of unknown function [Lactiplantibacillus plantarum]